MKQTEEIERNFIGIHAFFGLVIRPSAGAREDSSSGSLDGGTM